MWICSELGKCWQSKVTGGFIPDYSKSKWENKKDRETDRERQRETGRKEGDRKKEKNVYLIMDSTSITQAFLYINYS